MNLLDSMIEAISPQWAAKRLSARAYVDQLKSYNAAKKDRFRENWIPVNASAEQTNAPDRDVIRSRARDLERNNDIAKAGIDALIRNVIGTGILPQAATPDEALNELLEEKWKWWIKHKNCDITGQQNFYELQRLVLRRKTVDGEIVCHPVVDKSSRIPLRLQMIEADQFDTTLYKSRVSGNYILSGVEVDSFYKSVNYWFYETKPDDFMSFESKPVPAKDVIHLFEKIRVNQVRGISELVQVMDAIRDTEDYLDAELTAARIAACYALFITSNGGVGGPGRLPVANNGEDPSLPLKTIVPGMVKYLKPGEDVQAPNPARASAGVKDFIEIETRKIGAGTGQSYEVVSRDMSKSNYSSARQNGLEDRKTWVPAQKYVIDHFNDPIWELFVQSCVLSGEVKIRDFWTNPEKYYAVDWIAPGWTWIDPLKDVKASQEELKSGLNTLKQICAEQGKDWREVLRQRAKEQDFAKTLGLELAFGSKIQAQEGSDGIATQE
jgi:lambda family phage portal protein